MKPLCYSLLIILLFCFSSFQTPYNANVLGSVFHRPEELKLFKGYKELGSYFLQPIEGKYGLQYISKGNRVVILFEKIIENGKEPKYQLLDTVVVEKLESHQTILLGQARHNGQNDDRIVALVNNKIVNGYFKKVYKAWRANKLSGKLENISVSGIDCFEDGDD